jgi:hypothetical protein
MRYRHVLNLATDTPRVKPSLMTMKVAVGWSSLALLPVLPEGIHVTRVALKDGI